MAGFYKLTKDAYEQYQSLLAEQGIKAEPKSRETFEILDTHELTDTIHGILHFKGHAFNYEIRKHGESYSFELQLFESRRTDHTGINEAFLRAFPQPAREIVGRPHLNRRGGFKSLLTEYGCLVIILLLITILVFAVIGVRSLFK